MILNIILLVIAVAILYTLFRSLRSLPVIKSAIGLICNAVLGVGLFLVTNTLGITNIQVDLISVLVSAIGGIPGSVLLIILNVLGIY